MKSMSTELRDGKTIATIEKTKVAYNGKMVAAKKLTIKSHIPIDLNTAWKKVKTPALLEFVTKGKIKFKPTGGKFPEIWKEGETISTKMFIFGFLPFGGIHYLFVEKIDDESKEIIAKEWDNAAKVWNHRIEMKEIDNQTIEYLDEIIIYGGVLTGFIILWAKFFYIHRQKRWHLVKRMLSN